MKATEFAYWLQGYFKINDKAPVLTLKQAAQVLEKAATVKAGFGEVEAKAQALVTYTQERLHPMVQGRPSSIGLEYVITENLQKKLDDLFVHMIAPYYKADQDKINAVRKPLPSVIKSAVMSC